MRVAALIFCAAAALTVLTVIGRLRLPTASRIPVPVVLGKAAARPVRSTASPSRLGRRTAVAEHVEQARLSTYLHVRAEREP